MLIEILKNTKKLLYLLQFSFGYADSSSLLSLTSGATTFIGFWLLAWPMHLQNSKQGRVNLTQEQSAVLHPVLQLQQQG